jgi:hypothetical protein
MTMTLDIFKESPYEVLRDYFQIKTDWQTTLNLLYKNSEKAQESTTLWFKIKNRKIFSDMPDLKTFCEKLNQDFNSEFFEGCEFNDNWYSGTCNCSGIWHIDGPVISLSPEHMDKHKDIMDVAYVQVLGKSFWKLNDQDTVVLNPSDVLLLPKTTSHEVWGEGPRLGILLFSIIKKKPAQ